MTSDEFHLKSRKFASKPLSRRSILSRHQRVNRISYIVNGRPRTKIRSPPLVIPIPIPHRGFNRHVNPPHYWSLPALPADSFVRRAHRPPRSRLHGMMWCSRILTPPILFRWATASSVSQWMHRFANLPGAFEKTTPLGTLSDWGWHTFPIRTAGTLTHFHFKEYTNFEGRKVPYADVPHKRADAGNQNGCAPIPIACTWAKSGSRSNMRTARWRSRRT